MLAGMLSAIILILLYLLSQWIEGLKKRRWEEKHSHLTPKQKLALMDEIAVSKIKLSRRVDIVIYLIIAGSILLIIFISNRGIDITQFMQLFV